MRCLRVSDAAGLSCGMDLCSIVCGEFRTGMTSIIVGDGLNKGTSARRGRQFVFTEISNWLIPRVEPLSDARSPR